MNQNRNFRPKGRFGPRGRFDNSSNVRCPRVASRTVDKDKGKCYYCKEIGHFVSKCTKKIEDERGQARYNSMGQGISQFEDWEVQEWDDDYVGGKCVQAICHFKLIMQQEVIVRGGSRISHWGGANPHWRGHQPPTQALFSENICKNKRIWSCWGGVCWKLLYVDPPLIVYCFS